MEAKREATTCSEWGLGLRFGLWGQGDSVSKLIGAELGFLTWPIRFINLFWLFRLTRQVRGRV